MYARELGSCMHFNFINISSTDVPQRFLSNPILYRIAIFKELIFWNIPYCLLVLVTAT